MGNLAYVASGSTPDKSAFVEAGIPYLKMYNLRNQSIDFEFKPQYIKKEVHYGKLNRSIARTGDLIMNIVGPPLGKLAIIPETLPECNFNQAAVLIHPFLETFIINKYLYYYLGEMSEIKSIVTKGTAGQENISLTQSQDMRIALPPLAELQRIVVEVERLYALVDTIENTQADLATTIAQTNARILYLAIHGKLVQQDPKDDPAEALLRRINPKWEPSDNPHYEQMPLGWAECALEDILDYEQPQAYIVESTDYSDEYTTPVLTAGKSFVIGYTNETKGICNNLPVIIFDDFTTDSKYVDFPFKVKSSAMKILHTKEDVNPQYVQMFMGITKLGGDTHKRYWISEYSKLHIGLPPVAEQKRIVIKVAQLVELLDNISLELYAF